MPRIRPVPGGQQGIRVIGGSAGFGTGPFNVLALKQDVSKLGATLTSFLDKRDNVRAAGLAGAYQESLILNLDRLRRSDVDAEQYRETALKVMQDVRRGFQKEAGKLGSTAQANLTRFMNQTQAVAMQNELKFALGLVARETLNDVTATNKQTADSATRMRIGGEQPAEKKKKLTRAEKHDEHVNDVVEELAPTIIEPLKKPGDAMREAGQQILDNLRDASPQLGKDKDVEQMARASLMSMAITRASLFATANPMRAIRLLLRGQFQIANFTIDGDKVNMEFVTLTDEKLTAALINDANASMNATLAAINFNVAKDEEEARVSREQVVKFLNGRMARGASVAAALNDPGIISLLTPAQWSTLFERDHNVQLWVSKGTFNDAAGDMYNERVLNLLDIEINGSLTDAYAWQDETTNTEKYPLGSSQIQSLLTLYRSVLNSMDDIDTQRFNDVRKSYADLMQGFWERTTSGSPAKKVQSDKLALFYRLRFLEESREIKGPDRARKIGELFFNLVKEATQATKELKGFSRPKTQRSIEVILKRHLPAGRRTFDLLGYKEIQKRIREDPLIDDEFERFSTLAWFEILRVRFYEKVKPAQKTDNVDLEGSWIDSLKEQFGFGPSPKVEEEEE